MKLSNRLLACCAFVPEGARVADIGCDHGYLGIHLLLTGRAASVLASDMRRGPLQSARQNAEKYGVNDRMRFYLADGLNGLPRDFDCMVCAGMGGDTIQSILQRAPWLRNARYSLILQCQSKRPMLRAYLSRSGYTIERETLAQDGKFIYPVMLVRYAPAKPLTPEQCYLSPALLQSGSPLLPEFRRRVCAGLKKTVDGLSGTGGGKHERYSALYSALAICGEEEK